MRVLGVDTLEEDTLAVDIDDVRIFVSEMVRKPYFVLNAISSVPSAARWLTVTLYK